MKVKLISVILIICLILAGCGGGSKESSSNSSGDKDVVTLDWFFWASNDKEIAPWKQVIDNFNKENPNIRVNLQTAPWAEYWSKLQTQVAGGTAPDIMSIQSMRLPGYGSALKPLDEFIQKDSSINMQDFNENILENFKYEGKQSVIPYDFGTMVIYYNKDLFIKNNVPLPQPGWTWQDFENASKALSKGDTYGFVVNPTPDYWLPMALSNGGKYVEDGKYKINDPKSVETVQTLANLIKDNQAPKIAATNNGTWAMEQWLKGNIGMIVDGPWDVVWYKDTAKFDFAMASIPVGSKDSVSVSAGSGFAISNTSEHAEEAYKVISYLTSEESQKVLAAAGRAYPSRDSSRPTYFEQVPEEYKKALEYADQHTVPYKITKTWGQASDMITKAMIPILNGEKSAKNGLDELQKQLEAIQ